MSAISEKRECGYCYRQETQEAPLKWCAGCYGILYCNQDHQKAHWPKHKPVCQIASAAASIQSASTRATAATSTLVFKIPSAYPQASTPYVMTKLAKDYLAVIKDYPPSNLKSRTEAWKPIGQKIFDEAKENGGGDSQAGREALQGFSDKLKETHYQQSEDLRRAWNGVGDSNFTWQS
jgi:hypothetical protein